MKKFTFKTEKSTGRFKSFHPDYHHIKLNKKDVGNISDVYPYTVRLQVVKKDINEDGNPNCSWKWIKIKREFNSIKEAKEFLNVNIERILKELDIYIEKN